LLHFLLNLLTFLPDEPDPNWSPLFTLSSESFFPLLTGTTERFPFENRLGA